MKSYDLIVIGGGMFMAMLRSASDQIIDLDSLSFLC